MDLTADSADPESPRVRQMMEEYVEVLFPAQQHFGDVAIYVRKGDGRGSKGAQEKPKLLEETSGFKHCP